MARTNRKRKEVEQLSFRYMFRNPSQLSSSAATTIGYSLTRVQKRDAPTCPTKRRKPRTNPARTRPCRTHKTCPASPPDRSPTCRTLERSIRAAASLGWGCERAWWLSHRGSVRCCACELEVRQGRRGVGSLLLDRGKGVEQSR